MIGDFSILKKLICVTALLALMTGGIIWCDIAMNKKVDTLLELCCNIKNSNDLQYINSTFNTLDEKWHDLRNKLFMALHHADIDSVDYAVTKLEYSLKTADFEKIYSEVDSLIYYLDDLLDTEVFSITNIL